MSPNYWRQLWLSFLLLLISVLCVADDSRPAYLELTEQEQGLYQVIWKRPQIGEKVVALQPEYPAHCEKVIGLPERALAGVRLHSYQLNCGTQGLRGYRLGITGLSASYRDVLVKLIFSDYSTTYILRNSNSSVTVAVLPDQLQVIKDYVWLGIEHILLGIDHLLFVCALLFLVVNLSALLKAITAFTVSHSITLAGAVLGWFSVPLAAVEACIALSIVFLAVEIIRKQQQKPSFTQRSPWVAALLFGLVHGFGFAGALAETGLPETDIPLALFSFNVGVEVGQIMFVIPIYALLSLLGKTKSIILIEKSIVYVIGSVSSFWLIDRLLLF